jgi:Sulfotransferase domain
VPPQRGCTLCSSRAIDDEIAAVAEYETGGSKAAPILVTGMMRSGTTWVGRMLCASGRLSYISEPLNPLHPGIFRLPVAYNYTYISSENEQDFLPTFLDAVDLRARPIKELGALRRPVDAARVALTAVEMLKGRLNRRGPLFKDPHALFSAGWFADRLGCRVVVCVRHPAAVVSSHLRLGWHAPLAQLLAQPALVRDWLRPVEPELVAAVQDDSLGRDVLRGNALLWKVVYQAVSTYAQRRPDFTIVRHEDLSNDPVEAYADLYSRLELPFEQRAADRIASSSSQENPSELAVESPHRVRLDSRRNVGNWRRRLGSEDVALIRRIVEPVSSEWYGDADWD